MLNEKEWLDKEITAEYAKINGMEMEIATLNTRIKDSFSIIYRLKDRKKELEDVKLPDPKG